MDQNIFEKILAVLKITNSVEAQAARVLVETGEALARGNTAPLELVLKAIDKTTDTTAAKIFFLILIGVLFEVSRTSNQADKFKARRGYDKAFLKALKILKVGQIIS